MMLASKRSGIEPEILSSERGKPIEGQTRLDWPVSEDFEYLPQEQRPHLQIANPARKAVPPLLDSQGGTAGNHHPHVAAVNQEFQLGSPIVEILNLVEKEISRLPGPCRLIERLAQNGLFKPVGKAQNRFLNAK